MIMKTHKVSAVLLSLFMSINTVSICYAEEINDDTTKINTVSNEEYENTNDTQSIHETDENVIEEVSSLITLLNKLLVHIHLMKVQFLIM